MSRAPAAASPDPGEQTRRWLAEVVVGLDLCPFARVPWEGGKVAVVVAEVTDLEAMLTEVLMAATALLRGPHETTLLVLPWAGLARFEDLLDAVDLAEALLDRSGHTDRVQLVGFHPDYRFADADPDDPANATNRSPHPMVHLLRRADVARAAATHPDVEGIPARNIALLRELGEDAVRRRWAAG
jgi:uncharacterized protein